MFRWLRNLFGSDESDSVTNTYSDQSGDDGDSDKGGDPYPFDPNSAWEIANWVDREEPSLDELRSMFDPLPNCRDKVHRLWKPRLMYKSVDPSMGRSIGSAVAVLIVPAGTPVVYPMDYDKLRTEMVVTALIVDDSEEYEMWGERLPLFDATSHYDNRFVYRVGTVQSTFLDDDTYTACSKGIHGFKTFEEASNYRYR